MKHPNNLIIFDGVCNFCSATSKFIIQRDPSVKFSFTTTQSNIGIELLSKLGVDPNDPSTFVLIKNKEVFLRSNAALEISKDLSGPWRALAWLRFVPLPIRDSVYGLIARNRYKLMGKRESCMVPTTSIRARFIE